MMKMTFHHGKREGYQRSSMRIQRMTMMMTKRLKIPASSTAGDVDATLKKEDDDKMEDEEPQTSAKEDAQDSEKDDQPAARGYTGEFFNESKGDGGEKRSLSDLPRGETESVHLKTFQKPQTDAKIYTLRIPDVISVADEPETEHSIEMRSDTSSATIRYRERLDDSGNRLRESNTRLVKWSDGSLQLIIGTQHFDITEEKLDEQLKNRIFIYAEQDDDIRQCHGHVSANMRISSEKARELLKIRSAKAHQKKDKAKHMVAENIQTAEEFERQRS
eukprot:TRINITY_DN16932_c0_g1_i1.p1 TRINITY_DN16932_c0_g1~~TRINITY_DN16932_c0_g1_i1.p1  ORF type:complete len:275 (+),score=66.96 TRINITY_DN16932_c0_g1_i1:134-958(+)